MIIEGFEIENWSCIRKVVVADLPRTGVVVLHGQNRTGKSSIVSALRACLMDYQSTSAAGPLKSAVPRGSGEKPSVTVAFSVNGARYRVSKSFGTNKSRLERIAPDGSWALEESAPAEVHRRTCDLVGGGDSTKGLQQLLWLSQAQFQLPSTKTFDAGVQARLRDILGILQTPLDDRFIEQVKARWRQWYAGERKPGKAPSLKPTCDLAGALGLLEKARSELAAGEAKFEEVEKLIRQSHELELRRIDLARQFERQCNERNACREAFDKARERIVASKHAKDRYVAAEEAHRAALQGQWDREQAVVRLADAERSVRPMEETVAGVARTVQSVRDQLVRLRNDRNARQEQRRQTQALAAQVADRLSAQTLNEQLKAARRDHQRAVELETEIGEFERRLAEVPAPDEEALSKLSSNRRRCEQLRADRDAASIAVNMEADVGAPPAQVSIDGAPPIPSSPKAQQVKRSAELVIPGWGRIAISRGVDAGTIDQIEDELKLREAEFSDAVAAYGLTGSHPQALETLQSRLAERRHRLPELEKKRRELKLLAPKGSASLFAKVLEYETKLSSADANRPSIETLPEAQNELENLAKTLQRRADEESTLVESLTREMEETDAALSAAVGQESKETIALAEQKAIVATLAKELSRLPAVEKILANVEDAKRSLESAQVELNRTQLTEEETSFESRLAMYDSAVHALEQQIRENQSAHDRIKGRLEESEGLHSRRTALAVRVDELIRRTSRENLERKAVDRLYELFEECRDRRLGALLEPIHERVLGWMRVLDLGSYQSLKFTDAFLPERLVARDGTAEFEIDEESTGAQEQIGMLVRLALGSILSTAIDPAVAIFDDPLTHCDVGRLNKLRSIIRRASEGDPNSKPAAGPLQIIILTCHPEWFRDESATVIDLENPDVLQRLPY